MIKVEDVSFHYKNGDTVLNHISFSIYEGEVVAIVGKNGSGKSTLGKLIAGILKLKDGKILIDDKDISKHKNTEEIRKAVGIVFQNPENQIIFSNVRDEISFSLKGLPPEEINERIAKALKQVDMMDFLAKDLYTLSLGQKQRMMIAEILARNPKYIVLDEPTTMIDSLGKEKIYQIIQNLKKQGYTIICITNLADEILLADRTLLLDHGKIVKEILKEDLVQNLPALKRYHIKVPTILQIIAGLKERGITLSLEEYTVEALTRALIEKFKR